MKVKLSKIAPLENLSLVDKVELRLKAYFKENNCRANNRQSSKSYCKVFIKRC